MKEKQAKKYTEQFARGLARCDIASFLGVAKLLNVRIHIDHSKDEEIDDHAAAKSCNLHSTETDSDNNQPRARTSCDFDLRPFEDVFGDILDVYDSLARGKRRELLKIVKAAGEK